MTIQELHFELKDLGISEDRYFLHGLYGSTNDNDKLSLIIKKGKYFIEYEVYFKERGEKNTTIIFTNEDEACQYLLKRFKNIKEIEEKYLK